MSDKTLSGVEMNEGEFKPLDNNTWTRIITAEYSQGSKKLVKVWKFTLKPDSNGDLRVMKWESI